MGDTELYNAALYIMKEYDGKFRHIVKRNPINFGCQVGIPIGNDRQYVIDITEENDLVTLKDFINNNVDSFIL